MEMIDVLKKLREIAEKKPELVKDAVENVEKTNPKVDEGKMKDYLHGEAEKLSREEFLKKHGESLRGFYNAINGSEDDEDDMEEGKMMKKETRDVAKKLELNVADKPDSQDICFVPNGDYASVIKKFRPDAFKKGNIKDLKGNVIGVHDGIINFTIGQRKGIKVSDKEALYVIKINSEKNEIIVGSKEYLGKKDILLKNVNLLANEQEFKSSIFVKVRSTGKLLEANVNLSDQNGANVNLKNPEDGISPGQACVFYNKDALGYKVLGGGWIKE